MSVSCRLRHVGHVERPQFAVGTLFVVLGSIVLSPGLCPPSPSASVYLTSPRFKLVVHTLLSYDYSFQTGSVHALETVNFLKNFFVIPWLHCATSFLNCTRSRFACESVPAHLMFTEIYLKII